MSAYPRRKADLANWCRALPRPPQFPDSDSNEVSAFLRPKVSAFTARPGLAASEKGESSRDKEATEDGSNKSSSSSNNGSPPASLLIDKINDDSDGYTNQLMTKSMIKAVAMHAMATSDNECAIDDDDKDDHDDGPNNPFKKGNANGEIDLGSDDDLWEDEDGTSYNANGTAVIKTAIVVRRGLQKQQHQQKLKQKGKKVPAELTDGTIIIGGKVKHARHPDGTLVSNLSEQLRRAARLVGPVALSHSGSTTSIGSTIGSETNHAQAATHEIHEQHAAPAGHEPPFTTGNTELPNPLRCHPGPVTPPHTPPEAGAQSPGPPPPPPPSTPQVVPTARRSRVGSRGSLPALLTPPMSPTTVVATMATAVATILNSSSGTTSTIALMAVSNASSGTASGRTSTASSLSSAMSRATPKRTPPVVPPETNLLHIKQINTKPIKGRIIMDAHGDGQVTLPFNGCYGPRLEPTIDLAAQRSLRPSPASSTGNEPPRPRRKLIRSASSDLLHGEATDFLLKQILDENNSRYIFQHFGTRRFVDATPGPSTLAPPPFHRTESTPNVCREPLPTVAEESKGKEVARGPHGFPLPVFRQVYFVDDYKEPEDWSWDRGYHSKGW
ncbi:hypothetical protein SCUCBS95973_009618 [Sporothrix curviconia]|uniref:Uncharacterized protein n=1 Tax=Sporothrix curviconia TaxID=1260050 RepID=A0ABP0CX21_9PEZI